MSTLRPEAGSAAPGSYCPTGGTAYLMVYNAVKAKHVLIHGHLHQWGESCAIGSFWDVNDKCALTPAFVDEVAAVNDSVPNATAKQRRAVVLKWLRWKLAQVGMPGFKTAKQPRNIAASPTRNG